MIIRIKIFSRNKQILNALKRGNLLYSLVDNFKGIGPSMHVDKGKSLARFNSIISCKSNYTTKHKVGFSSFEVSPLYIFFSKFNMLH